MTLIAYVLTRAYVLLSFTHTLTPVICDKIVETTEKFIISLILPSNNSQVRAGKRQNRRKNQR